MTSQIFKAAIPNKLLFDLLEENAIKAEKFYIVNNNVYKKGIFKPTKEALKPKQEELKTKIQ